MSRIGKKPVTIPSGVKASIEGSTVKVEGPKGKLSYTTGNGVGITQQGNVLQLQLLDKHPQSSANFGTARAVINNMVEGVSKGWKRSLELNGVGYTAKVQGQTLTLTVGFSHDVTIMLPASVKGTVTKNVIELESPDRHLVGLIAAKIRKSQPPEPYLGKGIKYTEETIRRKAGKTGKK
ncbi:MAG: 50S ribosomal protein L6 [Bdellovibrionota bacterium]|nr:MAG: 50S ribosomal protein L6 [Bdellovibrionota bacterium]